MQEKVSEILRRFDAVAADPQAPARAAAAAGRPVLGYFCSYVPQELYYAAGWLPVRIFGREGDTTRADGILQPYACSFSRSALDAGLSGELDHLAGVAFAHTCDTLQNVADLWRARRPEKPVHIFSLPNRLDGPAAHRYFRAELERVRAEIEAISGPVPDGRLADVVRMHMLHQAAMRAFYALRRAKPGCVTGTQALRLVTASFLMDRAEHLALMTELNEALAAMDAPPPPSLPRVLVSGSMCRDGGFVEMVESSGLLAVDDDLCVGSRSFALPDAVDDDPLDVIIRNYLARRPCPAFHKDGFDPGARLLEQVRAARAAGVVFLLTSFCDPMGFDYPPMRRALDDAGVPSLAVTIEQHRPVPEQARTRLAAFAEMLAEKATA